MQRFIRCIESKIEEKKKLFNRYKLKFGQGFKGPSDSSETVYRLGVSALIEMDFKKANDYFKMAANHGHISAYYNLFSINGGGMLSPYDIDLAADYWYKAAELGHPTAKETLFMLEAADRGSYGVNNLAKNAFLPADDGYLSAFLITSACRYIYNISTKYSANLDVIAAELDAASYSEMPMVQAFIKRSGVSSSFYTGGMNKLIEGSIADQITDGLNAMVIALRNNNFELERCIIARCTIVGYLINKSMPRHSTNNLLGVDDFKAA